MTGRVDTAACEPAAAPPGTVRAVALLVAREARLELSGREALSTVVPFAAAATLLAGLAFAQGERVLAAVGPGTVWLVVLLSAPALARLAAAAERDEGCWDLLRCLVSPTVLLAGKTGGLWLQLTLVWVVAQAIGAVLFPVAVPWPVLVAGPLGTLGLAVLTVALGSLLAGADRRGGLLAVLLLPLALPVLLAGSTLGTPGAPAAPWLALLTAYDLLIATTLWAVCPALLEE